jgi:hypothetical protein
MPPSQQASSNGSIDTATLELLATWRIQDATTDPEQIRAAAGGVQYSTLSHQIRDGAFTEAELLASRK